MTIRERIEWLALAEKSAEARAMLLVMMERDPVFFINLVGWTFDPRIRDPARRFIPFLLFDRQEELVKELEAATQAPEDLLIEKSRDTGVTWTVLGFIVHHWNFQSGFAALVGSRKVDLVDKVGDRASHFWRILFMIEMLPDWVKPNGWTGDKPHRTYLKIEHPHNGSIITGEAANEDFGRQGRYGFVFVDEFASWEWAAAAWTACGETTECRCAVSTPKGMNFFGHLANPRDLSTAVRKFVIDWKDDPRHSRQEWNQKTGKWEYPYYEKAKIRYAYDLTMLAQELDRDYKRSVRGRVYPQIDYVGRGRYRYDPQLPTYCAWDFGRTDETALGWFQYVYSARRYRMVDYFQASGHVIAFYIAFVTGVIPTGVDYPWEYTPAQKEVIQRHRGWNIEEHFGDPAGRQRNQVTNTSVLDELAKPRPGLPNGIAVYTNTRSIKFETRFAAARKLLPRLDVDEVNCALWLDAMENARYPERPETSQSTVEPNKPVHDWTSHGRSMFEYLAVNDPHLYELIEEEGADPDSAESRARRREAEEEEDDPMLAYKGIAGY